MALLLLQHPLTLIAGVIDVLDNTDGTCRVPAKVSVTHKAVAEPVLCLPLFSMPFPPAALNTLKESLVACLNKWC